VLSDWELWACANEYVRRYGRDAGIHAAMQADALFEAGDDDGAKAWRMIIARIETLMPPPGAATLQ